MTKRKHRFCLCSQNLDLVLYSEDFLLNFLDKYDMIVKEVVLKLIHVMYDLEKFTRAILGKLGQNRRMKK